VYHVRVKWLIKTRAGRIVVRLLVLALVVGFVYWRFFTPKIHTAGLEDVSAVVPKSLLQTNPKDPDAEMRLTSLIAAINKFRAQDFRAVINRMQSDEDRARAADKIWNDGRLSQVLHILASGPIRIPTSVISKSVAESSASTENTLGELSKIRQLERALIESAAAYRHTGKGAQSQGCLMAVLTISNKFWDMQGPLTYYLEAISVETSAMKAVADAALDPRTSPQDCDVLLKAIPPAPVVDDSLTTSMRNEFNWEVLPKLTDPYKDFKEPEAEAKDSDPDTTTPFDLGFKTSYDSIETATALGKSFSIGIENAARPLSRYNDGARQIQQKAATKLPLPPDLTKLKGFGRKMEKFRFRVITYNTDNYYGRVLITDEISDLALVEMSDRWRALRNSVRVALGSREYRASHGGAMPATADQFGAVLGVWPSDPYDGGPMKYNAGNEVVYSIGSNLVDDGGLVSGPSSSAKDVGISLKISAPSQPLKKPVAAGRAGPPPRISSPPITPPR